MPRPKSRPLSLHWHTVKPDVDKLIRSTLDGLADGQALERDQQVAHVDAVKRYEDDRDGWTGAHVTIATLDHQEAGAA